MSFFYDDSIIEEPYVIHEEVTVIECESSIDILPPRDGIVVDACYLSVPYGLDKYNGTYKPAGKEKSYAPGTCKVNVYMILKSYRK